MVDLTVDPGQHDHVKAVGNPRVTLVEYGDYQCPPCGSAYVVVKSLQQVFGDGLRFVFRNFPLTALHPEALAAALTAELAAETGDFWLAHDMLFENQGALGLPLYERIGSVCGFSHQALRSALHSERLETRVATDLRSGTDSGVTGTPTFFINGQRFEDAPTLHGLMGAIETANGVAR